MRAATARTAARRGGFDAQMALAAQAEYARSWAAALGFARTALSLADDAAQQALARAAIARAEAAQAEAARRAAEAEAARQAALRAAEAARRAAEEARRAAAAAEAAYVIAADECLRGLSAFTGHDPLAFRRPLATLAANCPLPPAIPGTLEALLRRHRDMFTLEGGRVGVATLTPFRGGKDHRVFGDFRCSAPACGRKRWRSANTYCDTWQKCQACETPTYPFKQRPLERREEQDDDERGGHHDSDRCQRCLSGRRCAAAIRAAEQQQHQV